MIMQHAMAVSMKAKKGPAMSTQRGARYTFLGSFTSSVIKAMRKRTDLLADLETNFVT